MNTVSGTYQQQLLLAMRLHNIPGPRIAEALAEVNSHIAETGENPYQAFGEPKDYTQRLSGSLGVTGGISWLGLLRSMSWRDGAMVLLGVAGPGLLIDGLFVIGGGNESVLDLPPVASAVAGLVLIVALAAWIVQRIRREADPVIDPRTGNNMAPPFPRWTTALWAFAPFCLLLLVYYISVADR